MLRLLLPFCSLILFSTTAFAQMWNGRDTLYGNEWIRESQSYFKFKVAEDGVYRIGYDALTAAGIPVAQIEGSRYQLFRLGEETPLYVSSGESPLSPADFLEFVGRKNRGELDRFLYADPDKEQFNPEYSLFSDTSVYFLTWAASDVPTLRYRNMANDLSGTLPDPEAWFWDTLNLDFHSTAHKKRLDSENLISFSIFDEGEGFGSPYSKEHQFELKPKEIYLQTEPAMLSMSVFSGPGEHRISLSVNGVEIYRDTLVRAYALLRLRVPIPLTDTKSSLKISLKDLTGRNLSIGNVSLRYARSYAFPGENTAEISAAPSLSSALFLLQNVDHQGQAPWVLDYLSGARIQSQLQGSAVRFKTMPGDFLVYSPAAIRQIPQLVPVSWVPPAAFFARYLLISHPRLMEGSAVKEYANYRSSAEGGSYSTAVVNVEQLYDQFAYGITGHPLAVKSMANWVNRQIPRPDYILLIGKGLSYSLVRTASSDPKHLIPGFGFVPSDNLLFSRGQQVWPLIPAGRIACDSPDELIRYLQKVKTYEASFRLPRTFDNHIWRKRGLHLVGGSTYEQPIFNSYLDQVGRPLQEGLLGAKLTTVKKTSTDPVPSTPTEQAVQALNEGTLIKTFLGHGAITVTDFGLDDPAFMDNAGRLPLAFSLGCLSGNVFTRERSVSERYILESEKGAIGYIASSSYAYPFALSSLTKTFYSLAGQEYYGKGVGEILQEVYRRFADYSDFPHRTLTQQFTFHGDPAITLNRGDKPDYVPDPKSVRISPDIINSQTDSLTIQFTVGNLGIVRPDSLKWVISHQLPSGIIHADTFLQFIGSSLLDVQVRIPLRGPGTEGLNRLFIRLDPENVQEEGPGIEAETNNEYLDANGDKGLPFFVSNNEIIPLNPLRLGTHGLGQPELAAFTSNLFAPETDYVFELDTTASFTSPGKIRNKQTANGGLVFWKPAAPWKEHTVYYWRVSPDSSQTDGKGFVWRSSSFRYAQDTLFAWGQFHRGQFQANALQFLQWDTSSNQLEFQPSPTSIIAEANTRSSTNVTRTRLLLNNNRVINVTESPSITVGVFSDKQGLMTRNISFPLNTPALRYRLISFLKDSIPHGFFACVLTFRQEGQTFFETQWNADSLLYPHTLFTALEAEGAQSVRQLLSLGPVPYLFAFRKGYGPIGEAIASPGEERVTLIFDIPSLASQGKMESPWIGPAKKWDRFSWQLPINDRMPGDSAWVQVYGARPDKQDPILIWEGADNELDLQSVDPGTLPFIKLRYLVADPVSFTPLTPEFWKVAYTPAGELALDPLTFGKDTLQQGDSLRVSLRLHNFGPDSAATPYLRYTVIGSDNAASVSSVSIPSIQPRGNREVNLALSSLPLKEGNTRLIVEVNPEQAKNEREPFNSQGQLPFVVLRDQTPPTLDVTVDGQRLANGAIVAPSPEFRILVTDENAFLPLRDTQLADIQILYPDGKWRKIGARENLQLLAGQGNRNQMELSFQPRFDQEGTYQLKVKAKDVSGNPSGKYDYLAEFNVVLKQSLSHLLPYPNPFSTSTRFWYTYTGEGQPDQFRLRIMTVSGRIVREVSAEEFGPLQVGAHLSDFVWDGTDQYGDRLANGVYLYQVLVKDTEGGQLSSFATGADPYLKKNIGKVVLLR